MLDVKTVFLVILVECINSGAYIAKPCKIGLRAFGLDDQNRGNGYVTLNGQQVTLHRGRGVTLVTITPECDVSKITQYDTFGFTTATADMRDYLDALPTNTIVAGITDDSYIQHLADVEPLLAQLGIDVTEKDQFATRTSLGFIFTKGRPENTVQKTTARFKGPTRLCVNLQGTSRYYKINTLLYGNKMIFYRLKRKL